MNGGSGVMARGLAGLREAVGPGEGVVGVGRVWALSDTDTHAPTNRSKQQLS